MTISPQVAATIVLTSGGYPGNYEKGHPHSHVDEVADSLVFYAGVKDGPEGLTTAGGRVIAVTSLGETLSSAISLSYKNARTIDFKGKYYRRDIGRDVSPI